MEKRALLAFLLSIIVLLIWDFYFTPTPPPTKTQQQTVTKESHPPKREVKELKVKPGEIPQLKLDKIGDKFTKWTVDSPLYISEILRPGARLLSFKLKKHRETADKKSPPMELITAYPYGYLPCAVELIKHQHLNLSIVPYSGPDNKKIVLDESTKEKVLVFRKKIKDTVALEKIYTWKPYSYAVDLKINLRNISEKPLEDNLGLSFYFLPYQENEPSYNKSRMTYFTGKKINKVYLKKLHKDVLFLKEPITWIGFENNYFIQAVIPLDKEKYSFVSRMANAEKDLVQLVYLSQTFSLAPQEDHTWNFRLYLGPKETKELKKAGHNLVASIDYGWVSFLAKPLLVVLNWLYVYTHNYGIAIIILTVLIKLIFWPLTHKSYQSMQKMKTIQPLIAQIREKYKDDREKLNQELLALYRTYKVNPMGGCLPIILQIPFFFALYRMLYSSVELRHQPFCLWINDLTAPDRLSVGVHIPYLGGIPVLTILMGVSMFVQQKMTPSPGDPRQEKMMLLMPVIFTVFFVNFPSGLVLYWFVNNLLSIVQQYWINRTAK